MCRGFESLLRYQVLGPFFKKAFLISGGKMYSFYLNEQEEMNILNKMLSGESGCSKEERAKQYHVPLEIAKRCSDPKRVPQELIDFVHKMHQEKTEDLKKSLSFHIDFWKRNGEKCHNMLNQLMEQEIPGFRVRLDTLCGGISDWVGTNVSINAFEYLNGNPVWYSTLVWETILALTFHRIRQKYTEKIYSDEIVWAVSEMTSCALINADFNVDWQIGYSQLFPHQETVIQMYKNRQNFTDFLEQILLYFKDKKIHF